MKRIAFVLLSGILFLAACGPKINSEQQERLEVLTTRVDSITEAVNAIDSVALEQMVIGFFERKEFLTKGLIDTIPYSLIFKIDSFVDMRREMGFIRDQFSMIKSEANLMNSQVKDLNHDVENRLVEEKQFERYYELEEKNSKQLYDAAANLFIRVKRVNKNYPRLVPVVDSIMDSYKNRVDE